MQKFRLELLADDKEYRADSCARLAKETRLIDGSNNYSQPDASETIAKARQWARESFSGDELEKLLNICVNQALLRPLETNWPGSYRAHSILFRELVDKRDSMFAGVVDEKFRKRLNNGRFWEELSDLSPGINNGSSYVVVGDVLENYFSELDVAFAQKGFELIKGNKVHPESLRFSLHYLRDAAIDRYAVFVEKLHEQRTKLKLSDENMTALIIPYLEECISVGNCWDDIVEEGRPRFEENGNCVKNFKQRLQEPWLAHYLATNDVVRTSLAEMLFDFSGHSWSEYQAHAKDVLSCVPEPQELFIRMVEYADQNNCELASFVRTLKPA